MYNNENQNPMKKITFLLLTATVLVFAGCVEGPQGPRGYDGRDGVNGQNGLDAEIYYSPWISPTKWTDANVEWYFDVVAPAITDLILDQGIVLAYMNFDGDFNSAAVRQLPAEINNVKYSFVCPQKGTIEFISDDPNSPPVGDHINFRYVIIPSNIALKSASLKNMSIEQIKKLPYNDLCNKLGISK